MQTVSTPVAPIRHMQHPPGLRPHRKILFLIDNLPIRVQKARAALGDVYALHVFDSGTAALEAMYKLSPQAVLVDERTLSRQGGGIHRTKCTDDRLKHIPFIIMSDGQNGPFLAGDGTGATDYFLKRPIAINRLMDRLANSMSEQVEASWKTLPQSAQTTLRSSADQFTEIAKAVANNTPLDKSQVTASCNPLVACVRENQHRHVLQGLRNHHNYTYVHSMRVAVFMSVFAQAYGVSRDEMTLLATGGYMHDVGKMVMPQNLLNKVDELGDDDWELMREHVVHSAQIVESIENVNPTLSVIAEQHHERLDGSGYPHGLKGLQINELGRMAAIADVFAAMTDHQPYKEALDAPSAFQHMENLGQALDQRLLKLFRDAVADDV